MIRLTKGASPQVLLDNGAEWTQVLLNHKSSGTTPTTGELSRYGHPKIKEALVLETHGKCAYCESKLRHITYGDIEHITPKVSDDSLRFQWTNLTLACDVCNTNKGAQIGVIDPYLLDPDHELYFIGPLVLPKILSTTGAITEKLLKLNRMPLVERRTERIQGLLTLLQLYVNTTDPNLRPVLRADIEGAAIAPETEHSAIASAFVRTQLDLIDAAR